MIDNLQLIKYNLIMRTCTMCDIDKESTEFRKGQGRCLRCLCLIEKNRRLKYNETHKNEINNNRIQKIEKRKQLKTELEPIRKAKFKQYQKEYRTKHREANFIYQKQYREKHREKFREYFLKYQKMKLKTDIGFRLSYSLRLRIRIALHGKGKSKRSWDLIGCNINELKRYLEKKFKPGMTWENWGRYGWHIDHIRPCISFDLIDPEQQKICFHYTNLQPLWAAENQSKRDKLMEASA